MRMQMRLLVLMIFAAVLIVACQGPPPTQIVLVVTATTAGADAQSVASETPEKPTDTAEPTITATSTITPTPDPFPTPVEGQIYVAEQRFETGRMFWLQPVGQLWVMTIDNNKRGVWSVYDDTFIEGEIEIDPTIVPPEELYQPERGFGKLWRENPDVREALGWALEPELGHTTRYEYHAGGKVVNKGGTPSYEPGPGYHIVESLYGDVIRFNEGSWTWQLDN